MDKNWREIKDRTEFHGRERREITERKEFMDEKEGK